MKFYLSIIIIIIGSSCTSQDQNSIRLLNNVTLKRFPGEYIRDPEPSELKNYELHFNNSIDYQIPLFKLFFHDNYKIFLGIPFNNNDLKIFNIRSKQLVELKKDIFIDSLRKKMTYTIDDKHILEEYHNIDNHSFFISFTETKIDSIATIFLKKDMLKNRFSYKP